jgi:glycerophosphoryl diester phosphodiesterase
MLKIISHRGFWITPSEQNTEVAFIRALECGFGIETDIRDVSGDLVISHDMSTQDGNYQSLDSFFCNSNI